MCVTFFLVLVEGLVQLACLGNEGEVWREEVLDVALMVVQKVEQVEKIEVAL